MFRRALLVALVLLAGCAPHGTAPGNDPSVTYLDGVETEYSYRLENLPGSEVLGPDTSMRNGLIAGDGEVFVASALFESDGYFTMDLIVLNHTDVPVHLERKDVRLVDHKGRWLKPVGDWRGAEHVGLRGKSQASRSAQWTGGPDPAFDASPRYGSLVDPGSMDGEMGNRQKTPADTAPRNRLKPTQRRWDPPVEGATDPAGAPQELVVDGNVGRTWWAYWQGQDVAYPLTAFVMLEGRHLVFRFQR
jgi:hypothetical protein